MKPPASDLSIYLASLCYGGQASAGFLESVLYLRTACAERRIRLHVELGGGEALVGRGRAAVLSKFLTSAATHLLFVDSDVTFDAEDVFRLLDADSDVVGWPEGPEGSVAARFMLISRPAAISIGEGYPELQAKLGDLHQHEAGAAAMVFDSFIDPETGRYLNDGEAFCYRWRALGGDVVAVGAPAPHRDGNGA